MKIINKEKLNYTSDVYCCTVDNYHNFTLGNNCIVHNCMQNESAGAQAFSSFDTLLAPFVRELKKEVCDIFNISLSDFLFNESSNSNSVLFTRAYKYFYKSVKQEIQQFIFNLNVPSRWGTQTPFTNITLDLNCPEDLQFTYPKIGGIEVTDYTYGDLQLEMDVINSCYIEVMESGDANGNVFTFPIPTYNITKEFDWNSPIADKLFTMTAKYGIPYFQNFINSDLDPKSIRSMCCRLQLDLKALQKRGNGLFGSSEQTGSIGVVTLNCARLGYLYKGNKEELLKRVDYLLEKSKESLEIKRKFLNDRLSNNFYPFLKRYLGTFRNHFSTIGVNGVNEMILNFTDGKYDISSDYGKSLAIELLEFIRNKLVIFQEETGHLYNLEATPAEGASTRFALRDRERYPDIIQSGTVSEETLSYYTNSSQLPVNFSDDIFEVLDHQEDLQVLYTGGTVVHIYLGESISPKMTKELVKRVCFKYKIPYVTISPVFSICPIHGYIPGIHEYCPICDGKLANN